MQKYPKVGNAAHRNRQDIPDQVTVSREADG